MKTQLSWLDIIQTLTSHSIQLGKLGRQVLGHRRRVARASGARALSPLLLHSMQISEWI